MSTVVLTNPKSFRVQRNLDRLQASLERLKHIEHRLCQDLAELEEILNARPWSPEDLIVVNGGDGSVQHLLTRLRILYPGGLLPRFSILPGGTTNMTAFAFNHTRSYRATLAKLEIALQSAQPSFQRHRLLQVNNGPKLLTGVFFGAASVVRGIEYFHQRLSQRRARSQWGVALVVLRAAWGMTRRQAPFAEPARIRLDGSEDYATLILLVTSLDRLILGIQPFWGQQTGSLNLTLIEERAPHFLRYLPRLLRGKPGRLLRPDNGYHSRKLDQMELTLDGPFTIDGEIFECQAQTIRIAATEPIEVLKL